ncbi:pilus assembly protein PilO (plasmid) [Candidatus Symbiopectobacterium sp. 'North America']|uniref:type 4b pilus protein PilO2 n=1 Tax=Candidatus Symbiopectobacterium sp. 'North America' TaxID=2794574 RepID=UPI0018C95DEA|nr:type 4b pilus protein PilO2 [Candidatus Symbiopectobacterium sp. 'North America']MBG6246664.1 pilus assembly protein PilO [Candidatus Symbiopectobacterium sp. 'North America']
MSVKFRGNKKDSQHKVIPEDTRIRVLNFHHQRFVVGLAWETIKAQRNLMKEVRKIGRQRNLDVVAIRQADSIQAGFAPKTTQRLRGGYSLIVTLASLLNGCCIAVVPLGKNAQDEEEFTLVGRTDKGAIHPISDTIYAENAIQQVVVDLKQELRGNKQGMEIPVYGDQSRFAWVSDDLNLLDLLNPVNIKKAFKLKPLTWGMTKAQLIMLAITIVLITIIGLIINQYYEQKAQERRQQVLAQMRLQEEINKKARYQAALDKLKHPWITTASVNDFIKGCQHDLHKLHLSIEGWEPATVLCNQSGISANYNRPENSVATSDAFVKAIKKIYGTDADFNITQTSMSAFSVNRNLPPNGDDPLLNMGDQLLAVISLFQSVNIPASFTAVPIKEVKTNEQGEELPMQDWQEYTFEVETNVPPDLIFKSRELHGVRLNSIIYTLGDNGRSISYKLAGSVYGAR